MGQQPSLVGRSVECAGLAAALARCRRGEGGVLLVSGDAGAGKTRLVTEALAGWAGCLLRGTATTGTGAYAPIVDVLREAVDRFGADLLHPHARILLPELGEPGPAADAPELVAAVRRTLRDVARQTPTVVVLEDLHWAQAATADMLPALAVSLAAEPLLLIATYRGEELPRTHPVRAMRSELRRAGRLVEVPLRPLGDADTTDLLTGCLGATPSPGLARAVREKSGGLPFYIEELAGALTETTSLRTDGVLAMAKGTELPLPDSVLDAVLLRTAGLRRRCETAVELAAVLGVRVDLPTLAGLVDATDVDLLIDAGLLTEQTADTAVFRHALARDALYRAIPWARRRAHHRLVAEHLTGHDAAPEAIAEHWLAAHEPERARPLLLAAANRHCTVHAYRDAAAFGRRALAIWPEDTDPDGRIGALQRLADCAEMCGEYDAAAATWGQVAEARQARGEVAAAAAAHRRIANAAGMLGDWAGARAAREAAVDAFAMAGDSAAAATERLALAEQLESAGHLNEALEIVVAAGKDADAANRVDLEALALALQGSIRAAMGETERGVAMARSGLRLALAERHPETAGRGYYDLAVALIRAADYGASADAFESGIELCRTHGIDDTQQACVACMAVAVRLLGDWDQALAIAHRVLDDTRTPELLRMVAEEERGLITVLRGDWRGVTNRLRQAADFGRTNGVFGIEVGATWGVAVAADLADDRAGARRTVSVLLDRCHEVEDWVFALPALRWVATFLATHGAHDDLARCHRMIAAATTRNSSPKMLSTLAHAGGELALADGDAELSAAQFGRAVELLGGITAPFEHALSQLRWGTALAGCDERTAAVDTVTTAYRTARQLGAKPLARSCASELAGMGESVDRRLGRLAARTLEPAGLTRREREVVRLLADGRTNRQIAQELFLSTRTVDMHVRNLLTKLDSSTRTAAARRATELGLLDIAPTA